MLESRVDAACLASLTPTMHLLLVSAFSMLKHTHYQHCNLNCRQLAHAQDKKWPSCQPTNLKKWTVLPECASAQCQFNPFDVCLHRGIILWSRTFNCMCACSYSPCSVCPHFVHFSQNFAVSIHWIVSWSSNKMRVVLGIHSCTWFPANDCVHYQYSCLPLNIPFAQ